MDISESIDRSVGAVFNQWLVAHPYLAWAIAHPLPSLGLLLLAIFSFRGLFQAIARGIDRVWLFLLTTPFRLLQPILLRIWGYIYSRFGQNTSSQDLAISTTADLETERIASVVARLQQIGQEQAVLLQELAALTGSNSSPVEVDRTSDTQYESMYAKLLKMK